MRHWADMVGRVLPRPDEPQPLQGAPDVRVNKQSMYKEERVRESPPNLCHRDQVQWQNRRDNPDHDMLAHTESRGRERTHVMRLVMFPVNEFIQKRDGMEEGMVPMNEKIKAYHVRHTRRETLCLGPLWRERRDGEIRQGELE